MEIEKGKKYKVTDTTGLCGVFNKGDVVVPDLDKDDNLVTGAAQPEYVLCHKEKSKGIALFFHPSQLEAV